MASITTGLTATTIAVNAYGYSSDGIAPHFRLLVDGQEVGQATVAATSSKAYGFSTQLAAGQAHTVQVVYDNDAINSQYRDLYVQSLVVNGHSLLPAGATYERYDDGAASKTMAGQEGLWWDGALTFSTPASYYAAATTTTGTTATGTTAGTVTGTTTTGSSGTTAGSTTAAAATTNTSIVVNALGTAAGGQNAHFNLLVDGTKVGEGTAGTSAQDFRFTAALAADTGHKVQVQFDNDAAVGGSDRNLIVNSVTINGTATDATAGNVTYDKGALDGKDVVAGQKGLWWDGTLVVDAGKGLFAATGTSTTGTSTTSTGTSTAASGDDTIVVNAHGTAAGGVNAHFKLLVDGTPIGEGTAGTGDQNFSFKADLTADTAHKLQIQYDNDGVVGSQDRNLHVNTVTVNGHAVGASDSIVTYDRGALDGKDVIAGQSDLYWNGTLVVNADKSYFAGTTTSTGTGSTGTTTGGTTTTDGGSSTGDGYLHTEGSQIVDSAGNTVKLTGVNWFGAEGYAFAPQGLWQDSYTHMMDQMKAEGFNTIRLPWSDAMLANNQMPSGIDYSKNPDLAGKTALEVFDKIIDYADQTGMKIILDHHRSGDGASANENGLWYTDQYPESTMIANWKMLAQRYADNPSVIAADLHNEPHGSATWGDGNAATDWGAAAERIGDAIQTVNPNWLLIVEGVEKSSEGTYWWGGNLDGSKTDPIDFTVDHKLVYSVHDYPPSLAGFGWFNDSDFPNNMSDVWTDAWGYLIQNNVAPVLVGEFGTKLETTQDQQWLNALVKYMDGDWNLDGKSDLAAGKEGASWTYWAWSPGSGDTGGIMTDDWTVNSAKMDAISPAIFHGTIA